MLARRNELSHFAPAITNHYGTQNGKSQMLAFKTRGFGKVGLEYPCDFQFLFITHSYHRI